MDLTRLKNFAVLAKVLNFSKAAKLVNISQPALSTQIKILEKELDTQLFDRIDKRIYLTTTGKILHKHCSEIFQSVSDLEELIHDAKEGYAGEFVIAAVNSIGIHMLPAYVSRFKKSNPKVGFKVYYKLSDQVVDMVKANEVDLGIIAGATNLSGINTIHTIKNSMVFVCSKDHYLASLDKVSLKDLNDIDFIGFGQETPTYGVINNFLKEKQIKLKYIVESDNIDTMKKMVQASLGVSLLPDHTIKEELKNGSLKKLEVTGMKLERDIYFIVKEGKVMTKAIEQFMDLVQNSIY
ncbi:MAG: LysR family transcriptional regulator [Pseudomonadota bacterium]